jgi:hypothetical protein
MDDDPKVVNREYKPDLMGIMGGAGEGKAWMVQVEGDKGTATGHGHTQEEAEEEAFSSYWDDDLDD